MRPIDSTYDRAAARESAKADRIIERMRDNLYGNDFRAGRWHGEPIRKGVVLPSLWTEGRGWVEGPFTVTHVVSALSGPSLVVKATGPDGAPDMGKMFIAV